MTRKRALRRVSDSLASCGEFALFVVLAPVALLASVIGAGEDANPRPPIRPAPATRPDPRT